MPAADVIAGLAAAVTVGAPSADVVAVEARKHQHLSGPAKPETLPVTTTGSSHGFPA